MTDKTQTATIAKPYCYCGVISQVDVGFNPEHLFIFRNLSDKLNLNFTMGFMMMEHIVEKLVWIICAREDLISIEPAREQWYKHYNSEEICPAV